MEHSAETLNKLNNKLNDSVKSRHSSNKSKNSAHSSEFDHSDDGEDDLYAKYDIYEYNQPFKETEKPKIFFLSPVEGELSEQILQSNKLQSLQDSWTVGNKFVDNGKYSIDQKIKSIRQKMPFEPNAKLNLINSKNSMPEYVAAPRNKFRLLLGISLLPIALLAMTQLDKVIRKTFIKELEIRENSKMFPVWVQLPKPMHTAYYLFGIQNPRQFLAGRRPILKEYGPYYYDEYRIRTVSEWKQETVVYHENTHFEFLPELSKDLSQRITVLNYPLLAVIATIKSKVEKLKLKFVIPLLQKMMVDFFRATGEKIIERRSITELLDGRQVDVFIVMDTMIKPLRSMGIPIEMGEGSNKIRNQTFGFIWQRADIDIGPFENYRRGEKGHNFNGYYKVFNSKTIDEFRSPCNQIFGSDGLHFGLDLHIDKPNLQVYNPNVCRRLMFIYNSTTSKYGIPVLRYNIDPTTYDMDYSYNHCFCLKKSLSSCNGWSDMSPCMAGISIGTSFPHFWLTPTLARRVEGLNPDPNIHLSFVKIEPYTGLSIEAYVTLQLNMLIDPSIPGLKSVGHMLMPILWTFQIGSPDDFSIMQARFLSFMFSYGNLVFGGGMLLTALLMIYKSKPKTVKTKPIK